MGMGMGMEMERLIVNGLKHIPRYISMTDFIMTDFVNDCKKYRYLVLQETDVPQVYVSLREIGDALDISYSTISKHLGELDHCIITTEGGQCLVKKITWV